jgi:hypothetical protein
MRDVRCAEEKIENVYFCVRSHVRYCVVFSYNVFVFMDRSGWCLAPYLSVVSLPVSVPRTSAAVCRHLSCWHVEPRDIICVPSEFSVRMSIKALPFWPPILSYVEHSATWTALCNSVVMIRRFTGNTVVWWFVTFRRNLLLPSSG